MRLLVVTQYFWPENFRINDLVVELVQRGHDVTVLTGYPNYPTGSIFEEFRNNPANFMTFGGATIVRVPLCPRGQGSWRLILNYISFAVSGSVIGSWKVRNRDFDLIFTCGLSPITVGIPAAVVRFFKKKPSVFWVLDLWPDSLKAVGVVRSRRILNAVGKLVSFIYNRCDLILAQSKGFIPEIARYCSKSPRIVYFPSWAEGIFDLSNVVPAPEIPVATNNFKVIFAGNIGDAQDFPTILTAAERLKSHTEIRWLIIGDGRMANWVATEIIHRGLQDSVIMLGKFPIDRMPSFYKHADALLVSLKNEPIFAMTIPGKLQSYLAAGIPVVAMLNGEGANVVNDSNSGITCEAGNANALADAILRLASLPNNQRLEMGRNGLLVSTTEFDRNKLITRLEVLLEQLINDNQKGAA